MKTAKCVFEVACIIVSLKLYILPFKTKNKCIYRTIFCKNKEANNSLFLPTMPQTNYAKLNSFQVNAAENFAMGIIKDQL